MRKIYLFMLALLCAVGASAQSALADMSGLVSAATNNTTKPEKEPSSEWTCDVYPFDGSHYFGGIDNSTIATEFEGTGFVTVAAWVCQETPITGEKCIFSYGTGSTGWKFQLKGGKPEMVAKGKVVYSNSNIPTFESGKWYFVAYTVPGSANSVYTGTTENPASPKGRLYVGTVNNRFWTVDLNATNNKVATPEESNRIMSIGSSNPSGLSEQFYGKIAKLTVIKSTAMLQNSQIAALVGEKPKDKEDVTAELNNLITLVETHTHDTNVGYYSHAVADSKVAEARALANDNDRTIPQMNNMMTELGALATNVPVAGRFYTIKSTCADFANPHGLYVKKDGANYQMYHHDFPDNLTAADVFQIIPIGDTDTNGRPTYKVSNILDGDERIAESTNYVEGARLNMTASSVKTYALVPASTVASFYLNSVNGDCTMTMGKQGSLSDAEKADGPVRSWNMLDGSVKYNQYTIEEVPSYMLSVTDAGYATLYLDYATTIPEGVEVYTGSRSGNNLNLTIVNDNLPAEEGVVVKANEGSYVFVKTNENVEKNIENKLKGTVEATDIDEAAYVLSKPAGQSVGFYQAKMEGGKWTNNANRAYLPAGNLNARVLTFNFDDNAETGINAVEIEEAATANAAIYDLSGRRVQSAKSGLYIINGKKVIK